MTPGPFQERRGAPRTSPSIGSPLATARIRPGREVRVLDVSRLGVLVEGAMRLAPGSLVEIQIEVSAKLWQARGRVQRCYVSSLNPGPPRYRAALAFDRPLGNHEAPATANAPVRAAGHPPTQEPPAAPSGNELPMASAAARCATSIRYTPESGNEGQPAATERIDSTRRAAGDGIPFVHAASVGRGGSRR